MHKVQVRLSAAVMAMFSGMAWSDVSETGHITGIVLESNIVSVYFSGADATSECSGGARWTLLETDSLFKEKYASLLGAAHSGLTVTLYHLSGTGCGNWSSNRIYFVAPVY